MNHRILVVEDNKVQQKLMRILLEKLGTSADIVSSGKEALEAFGNGQYSLVLMDWRMPVMDGLECTEKIRQLDEKLGRRTPIIAVTANDTDTRDECLSKGMDDFLAKPFTMEQFAAKLARWLPDGTAESSP